MRHCVGGYCSQVEGGQKRIISLRDKDGRPAATIEVNRPRNSEPLNWDAGEYPPNYDSIKNQVVAEARAKGLKAGKEWDDFRYSETDKRARAEIERINAERAKAPWEIAQIKGPANRAPSKDVLPHVQDFVRNMGPWGEVRELENSGLRRTKDALNDLEREALKRKNVSLNDYSTIDELIEHQKALGLDDETARSMYFHGRRSNYAQGGAVGTETVGLGTFGGADNRPQLTNAPVVQQPSGLTSGSGAPSMVNGIQFGGPTGNAPSYDLSDPTSLAMLSMGGAMGAGRVDNGVAAFMPLDWSEPMVSNQSTDSAAYDIRPFAESVNNLGQQLGRPTTPLPDMTRLDESGNRLAHHPSEFWESTPSRRAARAAVEPAGFNAQYENLNRDLADIYRLKTASAGWDGKNDPRGTATTMYRRQGNNLTPISAPQFATQPTNPGWIRGEGADFVAAMSTMLPAVGGWAGLANTVAPSVVGAASGAIGQTATNALINAAMSGLISGNPAGALSSIAGTAGGAAGQALGNTVGSGYGALGQYLGNQAGRTIYNQTRRT